MRFYFSIVILSIVLFLSSNGYSCPNGQYEQCILPRPWGGCAQKVCVPNGGSITGGMTTALRELNQGVVQMGNDKVLINQVLGRKLGNTASAINWPKFSKVDWATAAFISSFVANGVACIASDGTSPGADFTGSQVICSENACACAAISLVAAIKNRSNLSEQDKGRIQGILNDPKFAELMNRDATQSAVDLELLRLQVYQAPIHFDPNGTQHDRDGNNGRPESKIITQ
ncbi:MAG: hypothetical protein H7318_00815 [Oligoflexus sp.]|nr:hypothetical protein [Oligoflexus sp.]